VKNYKMDEDYIVYCYLIVIVSSLYILLAPKEHQLKNGTVIVITGGVQGLGLAMAKVIA
jgi:hypothetical protein